MLHIVFQKFFCSVVFETVMLVWLIVALSCPFKEDCQVLPPPSMSLFQAWWRDVLSFLLAGSASHSSTLQIFLDESQLVGGGGVLEVGDIEITMTVIVHVFMCLSVCDLVWWSLFPMTPACPGQYTHAHTRTHSPPWSPHPKKIIITS